MATFPCSAPRTKTTANQSNLWISRTPKPDTTEAWPRPLTSHWRHGSVITSRLNQSSIFRMGVGGALSSQRWCHHRDFYFFIGLIQLVSLPVRLLHYSDYWVFVLHYCTTLITEYLYSITVLLCLYVHLLYIQFIHLLPSFLLFICPYLYRSFSFLFPFLISSILLSSLLSYVLCSLLYFLLSFPASFRYVSLWCLIKRVNEAGGISWAIVSADVLISDWSLQGWCYFKRKIREKREGGWFIKSFMCESACCMNTHNDNKISLHI